MFYFRLRVSSRLCAKIYYKYLPLNCDCNVNPQLRLILKGIHVRNGTNESNKVCKQSALPAIKLRIN